MAYKTLVSQSVEKWIILLSLNKQRNWPARLGSPHKENNACGFPVATPLLTPSL